MTLLEPESESSPSPFRQESNFCPTCDSIYRLTLVYPLFSSSSSPPFFLLPLCYPICFRAKLSISFLLHSCYCLSFSFLFPVPALVVQTILSSHKHTHTQTDKYPDPASHGSGREDRSRFRGRHPRRGLVSENVPNALLHAVAHGAHFHYPETQAQHQYRQRIPSTRYGCLLCNPAIPFLCISIPLNAEMTEAEA